MNEIAAVVLIGVLVWLIVDGVRIRRMVKRVLDDDLKAGRK